MCKYKKENHVEVSDGDTLIISTKQCPLEEKEATSLGINVLVKDTLIPCCTCNAYLDSGDVDIECPYFYKVIFSEEKGFFVDCEKLNPRDKYVKN